MKPSALPAWLPHPSYNRVIVSCTARSHGEGARRLPDRMDYVGALAAIYVEDADSARVVFKALDRPGRQIHVDVERKQDVDLIAVAKDVVRHADLYAAKPNDTTIRSLEVVLSHLLGPDLSGVTAGVFGTGNLAFKSALMLVERGASVHLMGRNANAVSTLASAINMVAPKFSLGCAVPIRLDEACDEPLQSRESFDVMVTALTARSFIGREWSLRLSKHAHVIDVGIDNLTPEFIDAARSLPATVLRLDTRASAQQVITPAPGFLEEVFGSSVINGVTVVSGGVIGPRGSVIVDRFSRPTETYGMANGRGGVIPSAEMTLNERRDLDVVTHALPGRQEEL